MNPEMRNIGSKLETMGKQRPVFSNSFIREKSMVVVQTYSDYQLKRYFRKLDSNQQHIEDLDYLLSNHSKRDMFYQEAKKRQH